MRLDREFKHWCRPWCSFYKGKCSCRVLASYNFGGNKYKPAKCGWHLVGKGLYVSTSYSYLLKFHDALLTSSYMLNPLSPSKTILHTFGDRHLRVRTRVVDAWNVVGWRLVLIYVQTSLTNYYIEFGGWATYMESNLRVSFHVGHLPTRFYYEIRTNLLKCRGNLMRQGSFVPTSYSYRLKFGPTY
jgi:hypothetical protein